MVADGGSPHPYIPATDADTEVMLSRLGLTSTAQLFDALPPSHRDPAIDLPPALAEPDLIRLMRTRAARNADSMTRPSFLGAGAYRRNIPSIVPYLVSRSEFMTAYTPYQPEISQGTLQSAFEYQSVVCELTGMDVSNTGVYDNATATAEACMLAARATGRKAIAVLEPVHPGTIDVIRTYAYGVDAKVDLIHDASEVTDAHACIVVQQPDFLGTIVDVQHIADAAHAVGALCVVSADPLTLGLLKSPGEAGADVVTGEGRDLAFGMGYGGPSVGLFGAREQFLRQMPGRIVGQTKELHGPKQADGSHAEPRTGYVLTLQAREQFIRRERATSNLSTTQALVALAFTITMQALGPRGLREAATLCYQRAHETAARIGALPGFEISERGPWFQEFLVRGPLPAAELLAALSARGITGGLDVSSREEPAARDAVLMCVTEATPPEQIDQLIAALTEIAR